MDTNRHESEDGRAAQTEFRFLLLGFVCFSVFVVAAGVLLRSKNTVSLSYQGKTLDQWLEEKGGIEPLSDEAQAAVRHMGTNALPRLLELLAHEDSDLRAWLYVNLPDAGNFRARLTPYYVIQGRGAEGIKALGAVAKPAIPALTKLFLKGESSAFDVAEALMATGPEGMDVVRNGLSSTNASIRGTAIYLLAGFGRTNSALVAVFRQALTDSDSYVRQAATNALTELNLKLEGAVGQLVETK